jgi:hypothetical protein
MLVAGLTVAGAPGAEAQDDRVELRLPRAKQGYYLGGGFRTGALFVSSPDIEDVGSFTGLGLNLRFGEMVTPWLGFGGVARFFGGSNDDFDTGLGSLGIEAQALPWSGIDLALRSSLGPFFQSVSRRDSSLVREDDPDQGFGAAVTAGVSFDWFPFYDRQGTSSGGFGFSTYLDGEFLIGEDFDSAGVFLGIEVTYFFGLPKNKLQLPIEEAF